MPKPLAKPAMSFDRRPPKLTPEYVKAHYQRMLEALIRKFRVSDPIEDVFHDILLAMMTPSKSLGTSYLDRYDPSRAYASTYLTVMATNYLRGIYRKENDKNRKLGIPISETDLRWNGAGGTHESRERNDKKLIANHPDVHNVAEEVESRVEQKQILKYLRSEGNTAFSSRNAKGKPRNTWRVVAMLMAGKSIPEIALEQGVTPVEVRRRVKLLATDPILRKVAKDHGWALKQTG